MLELLLIEISTLIKMNTQSRFTFSNSPNDGMNGTKKAKVLIS